MAFGNTNLVTDLVLRVKFTIIYATLFYVHNAFGYVLLNRMSGYSLCKIVMFPCISLKSKKNLTYIFEFQWVGVI